MKKLVLILTFLCCSLSYGQKEAANWYFGDGAGINFDANNNYTVTATSGSLSTVEGCTSISDDQGTLLFYTDGITVYNSTHQPMQNGNNLFGNPSSTQSAIIIPKPEDLDTYYIFTVDTDDTQDTSKGLHYSEVNMNTPDGLGEVTSNKNVNLLNDTTEKLSAVLQDCNSGNILVATQVNDLSGNDLFYIYEVSNTGIVLTGNYNTNIQTSGNGRGYLKFSPDGKKLVSANIRDGIYLYDFDTSSNTFSLPKRITIDPQNLNGAIYPYGVEFSQNSKVLYVSTYNDFFSSNQTENNNPNNHKSALLQYKLNEGNTDITATASAISASQSNLEVKQGFRSALQLGPDHKIYKTESESYNEGIPYLSSIEFPNIIGPNCIYTANIITLNNNARQGLPPFITSFFTENIDIIQNGTSTTNLDLCNGESYTLTAEDIPGATYTWTLNNSPLAENDFDLIVDSTNGPGLYEIVIGLNNGNCDTLEGVADITFSQIPIANTPSNLTTCSDAPNTNVATFDFSTQTPTVLGMQSVTQFNVSYYSSQDDADNNMNSITGDYQNTTNPQIIYVRIENVDNPNCYNTTEFELLINITPAVFSTDNFEVCDSDANPMDGITTVTLSNFDASILGTQTATAYTITYHETLAYAEANTSNHPNNYTNTTAFTEPIFVRIENNNDTSCYSTSNLNLIIKPAPEAFDTDLYQCDEDETVDGFTIFNLTEANEDITGNASDVTTHFYLTSNDAQGNTNEIDGNSFNNTTNPQTIYVRVTNDITGCSNFSELTLETSDTQIYNYHAPSVCDELGSEDGLNTFNLDDFSSNILNGLPATDLTISYYDNINDALLENNPLNSPYQNTTPYSQTLYVRVENNNACYGINNVYLTINPLPPLENDETVLYCLNDFPSTITLNSGLNDSVGNYSFNWNTEETTESIEANTTGTFTVTVTNNTTSCNKTRTIIVEPSNIATINTIEVIDGNLSNNQITILASGEGEYEYALTDYEGNTTPFQNTNVFTQLAPGIYTVTIRDTKNNCGSINRDVSIIAFPLYFTPNGDSINDTWQVYGVSSVFQPNSEITIFDRFGRLITQIKASSRGWDGTYKGKLMPASDYWFSVKLQDGREYKNHFALKR